MPELADALAAPIVERVVTASLRGAVVVALVWCVCRTRWFAASTRAMLWWTASLALVLSLLPLPVIELPVLPSPVALPGRPVVAHADHQPGDPPGLVGRDGASMASDVPATWSWKPVVVGLWLAGVAGAFVRMGVRQRQQRGIRARSRPGDDRLTGIAARLAPAMGVAVPEIRLSDEVASPEVSGLRHPVVLFPVAAVSWSVEALRMALCHELVHIRRRDLLYGWMPALAERLFFFHPLARLATREYLVAREGACDAAVVRILGVEPVEYGRLLVRLGVTHSAPAGVATSGASSVRVLRRRLEMMTEGMASRDARIRRGLLVLALFVAVLPLRLTAAPPDEASEREMITLQAWESRSAADATDAAAPVAPAEAPEPAAAAAGAIAPETPRPAMPAVAAAAAPAAPAVVSREPAEDPRQASEPQTPERARPDEPAAPDRPDAAVVDRERWIREVASRLEALRAGETQRAYSQQGYQLHLAEAQRASLQEQLQALARAREDLARARASLLRQEAQMAEREQWLRERLRQLREQRSEQPVTPPDQP